MIKFEWTEDIVSPPNPRSCKDPGASVRSQSDNAPTEQRCLLFILTHTNVLISAPWLSWLQRPTVTIKQSEGREFEPHGGSILLSVETRSQEFFRERRRLSNCVRGCLYFEHVSVLSLGLRQFSTFFNVPNLAPVSASPVRAPDKYSSLARPPARSLSLTAYSLMSASRLAVAQMVLRWFTLTPGHELRSRNGCLW